MNLPDYIGPMFGAPTLIGALFCCVNVWGGDDLRVGLIAGSVRIARTISQCFWREKSNKYHLDAFVVSEKYVGTAFLLSGEP